MTGPRAGDVRAFYAELGIRLPGWAKSNAPVRCFASPDAHRHGDRTPSCSVSLHNGTWKCHGCGESGGAYDAAIAKGHTKRSAMDLLVIHGLAERRQRNKGPQRRPMVRNGPRQTRSEAAVKPVALVATEDDVMRWLRAIDHHGGLICRLIRQRAWRTSTLHQLQIGFDGTRITIPIRNAEGHLQGVLRYDPFGQRERKMVALAGTRLGLIPHPASEPSPHLLLVEGPPDMIAARSAGVAAIAVPGTDAWQSGWATTLAGRHVTIVMDCDAAGRRAAAQVATDLGGVAAGVEIADLCPARHDGYDLTDRILERRLIRHSARRAPQPLSALLTPQASPLRPTARSTTAT